MTKDELARRFGDRMLLELPPVMVRELINCMPQDTDIDIEEFRSGLGVVRDYVKDMLQTLLKSYVLPGAVSHVGWAPRTEGARWSRFRMNRFKELEAERIYANGDAATDGALVCLDRMVSPDNLPHTKEGLCVNRVTRTVFGRFARPLEGMRIVNPRTGESQQAYDLSRVLAAAKAALGNRRDGDVYIGCYGSEVLWVAPNESGGATLMFPEDYGAGLE